MDDLVGAVLQPDGHRHRRVVPSDQWPLGPDVYPGQGPNGRVEPIVTTTTRKRGRVAGQRVPVALETVRDDGDL